MGSSLLLLHFILTLSVCAPSDDVCVAFLWRVHPPKHKRTSIIYNKTIDLTLTYFHIFVRKYRATFSGEKSCIFFFRKRINLCNVEQES